MGVTVRSLIAFAVSPVFLVLLGIFFYNIFTESIPPSFSDDTGAFYWFCFWPTVASACFLTRAWITFTAGLDLWRLKNRGRKLAYISMISSCRAGLVFFSPLTFGARCGERHSARLGDFS